MASYRYIYDPVIPSKWDRPLSNSFPPKIFHAKDDETALEIVEILLSKIMENPRIEGILSQSLETGRYKNGEFISERRIPI